MSSWSLTRMFGCSTGVSQDLLSETVPLRRSKDRSRYPPCNCCPYGYHIDLDFVRYCEALCQGSEMSASKQRRRERRRQRQSMEVLLGLTSPTVWNLEQQLPKVGSYYFQLRTAGFKAYCAIWVRRSNFRHQASPRVSLRESTQRRKVELWARNVR